MMQRRRDDVRRIESEGREKWFGSEEKKGRSWEGGRGFLSWSAGKAE
jgi:hypothetical protein